MDAKKQLCKIGAVIAFAQELREEWKQISAATKATIPPGLRVRLDLLAKAIDQSKSN